MQIRNRLLLAALPLTLLCGLAEPAAAAQNDPRVELDTSMGKIVVQLAPERAPITVQNFLRYVEEGHYNGTIFHRVIAGFMIQGGGFTTAMVEKPTHDPIPLEARGGLRNDTYTIAMARTSYPHSATSQFYINVADNDFLNADQAQDGGHAAAGGSHQRHPLAGGHAERTVLQHWRRAAVTRRDGGKFNHCRAPPRRTGRPGAPGPPPAAFPAAG